MKSKPRSACALARPNRSLLSRLRNRFTEYLPTCRIRPAHRAHHAGACRVLTIRLLTVPVVALLATSVYAAVGRTVGESNVSASGEATYAVHIDVPPGINGLTPDLALVYGHRQEQGIAGAGWGIAGLSEINRCGRTWAQDGRSGTVSLNSGDRFCRDGSQLRLVGGVYGSSGSTYRTEIDTFSRYTAQGTAGTGPAWFKVEAKNGLIYEFGNSADSRIESLATGWETTAITWALNKISDRSGNEIVFAYYEDGAPNGGHRIKSITYQRNSAQSEPGGYVVNFLYGPRPSGTFRKRFAAGGEIVDTEQLSRIRIESTFPTAGELIRVYRLHYESSASSAGHSRVDSVRECAGQTIQCLPATTFTYQDGTSGFGGVTSSGTTIPTGTKALPLDINGDGRTDLVWPSSSGAGTWYYRLATTAGGYGGAVNSGIANTNHAEAIAIDYDADGSDDILVPYSGNTWWAIQGSATGLQPPVDTGVPDNSTAGNAIAVDMNGDGLDDLVQASGSDSLGVHYREWGTAFGTLSESISYASGGGPVSFYTPLFPDAYSKSRSRYADMNGDGLKDLIVPYRELLYPYYTNEYRYQNNVVLGGGLGKYFVHISQVPVRAIPIDINGDGYTDDAYKRYDGYLIGDFSTGKGVGGGFVGPDLTNYDFSKAVVLDWDSDGYQDVLLPNTSTGNWSYVRSSGDTFEAPVGTTLSASSPIAAYAIDANGDGMDDLAYTQANGIYVHRPHSGVTPDLMKTAMDGNGNSITFEYAPVTESLYTRYTDATYPEQDYIGPLYVVSSATATTGLGSETYARTYTYAGARLNLQGRGLTGFDKKTTVDSRNGIKVLEFFSRDFPYRGRMYRHELRQPDDTQIQTVSYSWQVISNGSGYQTHYFPYLYQTIEANYEVGGTFNGAQINEVSTTDLVDVYGTTVTRTTTTEEMLSGNGAQSGVTFSETVNHTQLLNNTSTWCLGKPQNTQWKKSHSATYGTQIMRTASRVWDTVNCRLEQETVEPGNVDYEVVRDIGYDGFGNISSETVTGAGMLPRTTTTSWGTRGQFPETVTNPLGETTDPSWNYIPGVQSAETDPNGITVSWSYDDFGRRTRETRPDGTYTDFVLSDCTSANSYCGTTYNRVKTKVRASRKRTDGTEIRYDDTYLDMLDRPVQVERQMMSGAVSRVRTIYDSFGRPFQRSMPSFSTNPPYYTTTEYDSLNRPTQVSRRIDASNPALQFTLIRYEGLTTTTTDPEGNESTKIMDALGRVLRSIDHSGHYQQFDYDAFGSIRKVTDSACPADPLLAATYDYGMGAFRRTWDDMDMGLWSYSANALGEVVAFTDANGRNFSATFDKLSRPVTRTEPVKPFGANDTTTTTWAWGSSTAAHNVGRLESVSTLRNSDSSILDSESYDYDSAGRLIQKATVTDGTYEIDYGYDPVSGQLDSLTYPVSTAGYRAKLKYTYQYGVLSKVAEFDSPYTVGWQASAVDARGNVIDETLGNGVQTVRGFDAVTGRPDYILSGPGGGSWMQNIEYQWNKVGSLRQRKDLNRSLTEDFYYDGLHRLDRSELNGVVNLDLAYDDMGNITYKSDVGSGTWAYDGTRKHAVVNAGGNTYSYDANGNQVARNGDSVAWTSDNYPDTIENGTATHEFFYDANRDRWKQTYNDGTATETTVFVDDLLEKHTQGTVTEYRHYIRAGGKPIALYTRDTTGAISIHYLLRDHLGSLAEITTGDGNFHVSENFAAFGARRDATDWSGPPAAGDEAMIADTTGRGFTFHSNLEGSGLIHMNGRVADGLTGRFLSADPIVPDPGSTQSFNRYSYVNNNPLTYRDPGGFTPCLGPEAIICIDVFRTVFSFFGHDKKKSPPKGCHLSSGVPCYGKASSSKASNVVNDILKLPLDRLLDAYLCTRVMRSPLSCLGGGVFGGAGFGGGSGLPGENWDGITLNVQPSNGARRRAAREARRDRGSTTMPDLRPGAYPMVIDSLSVTALAGVAEISDMWVIDNQNQQVLHYGVLGLGPAAGIGALVTRQFGAVFLNEAGDLEGFSITGQSDGAIGLGGSGSLSTPIPLNLENTSLTGGPSAGFGVSFGRIVNYSWFKKVYSFEEAPAILPAWE